MQIITTGFRKTLPSKFFVFLQSSNINAILQQKNVRLLISVFWRFAIVVYIYLTRFYEEEKIDWKEKQGVMTDNITFLKSRVRARNNTELYRIKPKFSFLCNSLLFLILTTLKPYFLTCHFCHNSAEGTLAVRIKIETSQYRPGQVMRVPGGWDSKISKQSIHEGGKVVSPMHRPPLPPGNIPGTHFC
jgi:hypothetical protein